MRSQRCRVPHFSRPLREVGIVRLRARATLFYAEPTRGFFYRESMHRLTAGILLFFALAGTFVPLALASTAAPPHACCLRKAHHCHSSAASQSDQLVVRATSCCNHDCCRAITTRQWASPQPLLASTFSHNVDAHIADLQATVPAKVASASQSTRAPPAC
jgi:hypothetical protein